ncbi:hypothetical protein V8B97DRAFT_1927756 [Scleroderma yunnanense]
MIYQKQLGIGGVVNFVPLLCPSYMDSNMHQLIIHGVGCILVFEYSYFCLQEKGDPNDALTLAVKKYQDSGTQANVFEALQQAIQEHGEDHTKLQETIIHIILKNCMSNPNSQDL